MPLKLLRKEPRSTQVPESEGRLFYVLFSYLQGKAYNSLVDDSVKSRYEKWDYYDVQNNAFDIRNMVSRRVFDEYETLLDGLRNLTPWDKHLLMNISGGLSTAFYKFLPSHMEIFNKWKDIRFEGQFWYLGSCSEGGVFVYLGNSEEDERIFIVKALADPFSHIFSQMVGELPGFCFETVLLNWKDAIIYHGIIMPYHGYSAKEHIQRHERLTGVISRCENKNKVRHTLQADDNVLVDRTRFGIHGEMVSNFMKARPLVMNKDPDLALEIWVVFIIWTPTEDSTVRMTFEELTKVLLSGKTDGFKRSVTKSILVKCGENCPFCPTGIFGICPCEEYHRSLSASNGTSRYCVDGISVEQERTQTPPYKIGRYSLMDFYNFQFVVTREQFAEIIVRLEECSLFFHGDNSPEKESAVFQYVGPIVLLQEEGSCLVMTFGTVEMFYNENRILIASSSLTRAMNMLDVTRYIVLGDCDNQQKVEVEDMQIDIMLYSSMKNVSKVRENASELAKKFEEFIGGAVTIQIDKKTFDHRSCSYCRIGYQEKKLFFCKPCKEKKRNIMYCSRECQKSHWQYHKVTCKN
jgi:hypothetical protein